MNPPEKNGENPENLLGCGGWCSWCRQCASTEERITTMNTPCIEQSEAELVVIKGFEGEEIEVSVEQLETRIVPESTAGFLD